MQAHGIKRALEQLAEIGLEESAPQNGLPTPPSSPSSPPRKKQKTCTRPNLSPLQPISKTPLPHSVHPIFYLSHWQNTPLTHYNLLSQALSLATKLICSPFCRRFWARIILGELKVTEEGESYLARVCEDTTNPLLSHDENPEKALEEALARLNGRIRFRWSEITPAALMHEEEGFSKQIFAFTDWIRARDLDAVDPEFFGASTLDGEKLVPRVSFNVGFKGFLERYGEASQTEQKKFALMLAGSLAHEMAHVLFHDRVDVYLLKDEDEPSFSKKDLEEGIEPEIGLAFERQVLGVAALELEWGENDGLDFTKRIYVRIWEDEELVLRPVPRWWFQRWFWKEFWHYVERELYVAPLGWDCELMIIDFDKE